MQKLSRTKSSVFLALTGMICVLAGLGIFTFVQAKGYSYFSDSPSACNNCHVMRDQYDAWQHSSHSRFAGCNDCHTPRDSIVSKYLIKGINGLNHSIAFTFGTYGEVLHIRDFNADIVQGNCLGCHEMAVSEIAPDHASAPTCTTCHAGIGHRTRK